MEHQKSSFPRVLRKNYPEVFSSRLADIKYHVALPQDAKLHL